MNGLDKECIKAGRFPPEVVVLLFCQNQDLTQKEEEMETETTCNPNHTTELGQLYMAIELSQKEWKLAFSVGPGQAPRLRSLEG